MFRITKKWIKENKTKNGAWTKAQINALGLLWPPRKGWQDELHETYISTDDARLFEKSKDVKAGSTKKQGSHLMFNSAVNIVVNGVKKLNSDQLLRLRIALSKVK